MSASGQIAGEHVRPELGRAVDLLARRAERPLFKSAHPKQPFGIVQRSSRQELGRFAKLRASSGQIASAKMRYRCLKHWGYWRLEMLAGDTPKIPPQTASEQPASETEKSYNAAISETKSLINKWEIAPFESHSYSRFRRIFNMLRMLVAEEGSIKPPYHTVLKRYSED